MRFRKTITIFKGLKMNLSKSGVSFTVGGKGLSANLGKEGVFLNTGIPGTGLYDRKKIVDFGGGQKKTAAGAKRSEAVVDAALDQLYYLLADSIHREALEGEDYFGEGFFDDYEGDSRSVDTYIRRLRSKLGTAAGQIKTVIKTGYRLEG